MIGYSRTRLASQSLVCLANTLLMPTFETRCRAESDATHHASCAVKVADKAAYPESVCHRWTFIQSHGTPPTHIPDSICLSLMDSFILYSINHLISRRLSLLILMDDDSIFMVASGYFPHFSKLNTSVNCTATTDYFADNVVLMAEGHYLSNYKPGDSGIITNWLISTIPDDWTGLQNVSDMTGILTVWFEGAWQNDTYLENLTEAERAAYVVMLDTTHGTAYTCDNRKICDKLDVSGDPDVSGIGVSRHSRRRYKGTIEASGNMILR